MGSRMIEEQMLHATLCEIERGLFQVSYHVAGVGLGKHHLPRYQVGTCATDAQSRIEQRARECGYDMVVWESAFVEPVIGRPTATGEAARSH
jgi:hypothetical protein